LNLARILIHYAAGFSIFPTHKIINPYFAVE